MKSGLWAKFGDAEAKLLLAVLRNFRAMVTEEQLEDRHDQICFWNDCSIDSELEWRLEVEIPLRRPFQDSGWDSGGLHFNSGRVNGEKYSDSEDI